MVKVKIKTFYNSELNIEKCIHFNIRTTEIKIVYEKNGRIKETRLPLRDIYKIKIDVNPNDEL